MNLNGLYFKLPVWTQNFGISAYAWYRDNFFRENKYYPDAVKLVEKINHATEEEIEEWQLKQLNWIVNYAIQNTSFYKDYYRLEEVCFKTFEDFKQLPTINKQIVRDNWDKLQVNINDKVFISRTSGTTGSSLQLRISAKTTAIERAGFHYSRAIAGYKKGDKTASFIGRKVMNQNINKPPFWRYNSYDKQLIFSNWHVSDENLLFYIKKYNSFKPKYVNGYPSFLYLFAEYALRVKSTLHAPKAIFTGSETLLGYQKEVIEKAFDTKIYDHYGTAENLIVAHQCLNGKYHVREEFGYLEVINNEVYATSFHNEAFPLIRYKVGDLIELSDKKCTCGLSGRIIQKIDGRKDDIVISKSGKKYGRISRIFQDTLNVKEAQIIQTDKGKLLIKVVPQNENNFSFEVIKSSVMDKLDDDFEVQYEIVDKIPRTKSGKFRFVISTIKQQ